MFNFDVSFTQIDKNSTPKFVSTAVSTLVEVAWARAKNPAAAESLFRDVPEDHSRFVE